MNTEAKRPRGRPKKNLNASGDTKESLLQSGLRWLTQYGFNASSLDTILRSAKIPKGSFYHHFSNKEAYGLAVLQRYRTYFECKLDKFLLDAAYPPLIRLEHFVDDACLGMQKYQFQRGCLVGNLEQEVQGLSPLFRDAILATYKSWQQRIEACLMAAEQSGDLAQGQDLKHLANLFWVGWEGAVTRARLQHSTDTMKHFTRFFIQSISH